VKKFLKISITIIITLFVLIFFYLAYTTEVNRAVPGDAALAALAPTDSVAVADGEDWLVMRPRVIAGHSMGGAMAGRYAYINQDNLAGLILYDSYPPEAQSLADSDLPTAHIFRATLEGQPHPKFIDMAHVYPPKIMNFPVPGGIHMQFGTFIGGGYEETWAPQISNTAQLQIAIAATLKSLASMQ
jgi:pimeloyl-ACP methyl ester carboxylesterase